MRPINPPGLGKPSGYAHGMLAGKTLHVAGQVGARPEGGGLQVVPGGFAAQFEAALDNVLAVVQAAGMQPEHLAAMTVYITDLAAYRAAREAIGAAWRKRLGRHYPAMTLVEVAGLCEPGAVVEISAIAHLE